MGRRVSDGSGHVWWDSGDGSNPKGEGSNSYCPTNSDASFTSASTSTFGKACARMTPSADGMRIEDLPEYYHPAFRVGGNGAFTAPPKAEPMVEEAADMGDDMAPVIAIPNTAPPVESTSLMGSTPTAGPQLCAFHPRSPDGL